MSKPKSIADRVDAIRIDVSTLQCERRFLQSQRQSREELRESVRALIGHWRRKGEAAIARELQRAATGFAPEPLTVKGNAAVTIAPGNAPFSVDVGPLLLALFPEYVERRLFALMDAVPEGMDSAARRARLAEIDGELDRLESEEEALIEQSEIMGSPIDRRADARPEIVLASKV